MGTDLFAEQKRRRDERMRLEAAKAGNDIAGRLLMIDVEPEAVVVSSLIPSDDPNMDFRAERHLEDDPRYGGGKLRTWPTGREDPRHEIGFVFGYPYDAAVYLDRLTRAWLKESKPFSIAVKMKNGQLAEAHYILTVNALDWLYFSQVWACAELKRNESIPAMLGKLDVEQGMPSLGDFRNEWMNYLSRLDVFMHTQNCVLYAPEEPVKIKIGIGDILQRVRIFRSMSGITREMMTTLRRCGFDYSRQERQWQSPWTGHTDRATEERLAEMFTTVDYLPLETLGFLPEYRARRKVETRTVRFHPETWDILLGQHFGMAG